MSYHKGMLLRCVVTNLTYFTYQRLYEVLSDPEVSSDGDLVITVCDDEEDVHYLSLHFIPTRFVIE